MMRWWDNDVFIKKRSYSENEILKMKGELIQEDDRKFKDETEGVRRYTFRVQAETNYLERVAVTGSCAELGSWEADKLLMLDREGDSSIWNKTVVLLSKREITYRYVVVTDDSLSEDLKNRPPLMRSVRRWEAGEDARKIEQLHGILAISSRKELYLKMSANDIKRLKQGRANFNRDTFEEFQNYEATFGWLTTDIALHIKLFAKSVKLNNREMRNKAFYIKLRTIPLVPCCSSNEDYYHNGFEGWPVVEVSVLDESRRRFSRQPEYGTPICPTNNVIYQINADSFANVGIVLDFHFYENAGDAKPIHFGFSCIHPCKIGSSEGKLATEICNIRDETVGRVRLSYVFIFPIQVIKFKFHHSLSASWSTMWFGRDSDTGRKISVVKRCTETRNNRIYCVDSARHGVDYIRITVQFSKDAIPVFGHSPYLVVALKNPQEPFPLEHYQIRVEDMTASQLQRMTLLPEKCNSHSLKPDHKNPLAQQNWPFPSLVQLLNGVHRNVGFLIEFGTMRQLEDGSYPDSHDFDVNKYFDVLLKTTVQFAARRKIILASFHPDVCSIMKLKQNIFPVLFLQDGFEGQYPAFSPDPRCQDLCRAIGFAVSLGLHGVGVNTRTVLDSDNAWKIQNDYLIAFCTHEPHDEGHLIDHFGRYRLSGIINSTHDQYGLIRKNLDYILEPKEKERNYIRNCAEAVSNDGRLKPDIPPLEYPNSSILELEALRQPEPTQIAADQSYRTALKAQLRDEDEPEYSLIQAPIKSWATIPTSKDHIL